jgi:GTPases
LIEKKKVITETQSNALLVGWLPQGKPESYIEEYLDELSFLAETAGAKEVKRIYQKLAHPDSSTFLGSGKIEEIKQYIDTHPVDIVIFDDKLSGSQLANMTR